MLLGDAAAHRAFLDRLGHQARAGGRDRAGRRTCTAEPEPRQRRFDDYEDERRTRGAASCRARRATRPNGSRTSSATCISSRAVRLLAADPHQRISHENLRAARPARGWRAPSAGSRSSATGEQPTTPRAADVHAVPAARDAAEEPHRRLADGAVLGGRRHARTTSTSCIRRARQGRRRPGLSPR